MMTNVFGFGLALIMQYTVIMTTDIPSTEGARPVWVRKITIGYTLESGCLKLQEGGKPHLRLNMTTRPIILIIAVLYITTV
ncbi:Structural polyprotein [Dirofilaria immitis]